MRSASSLRSIDVPVARTDLLEESIASMLPIPELEAPGPPLSWQAAVRACVP
jgi:hypothetical protein